MTVRCTIVTCDYHIQTTVKNIIQPMAVNWTWILGGVEL